MRLAWASSLVSCPVLFQTPQNILRTTGNKLSSVKRCCWLWWALSHLGPEGLIQECALSRNPHMVWWPTGNLNFHQWPAYSLKTLLENTHVMKTSDAQVQNHQPHKSFILVENWLPHILHLFCALQRWVKMSHPIASPAMVTTCTILHFLIWLQHLVQIKMVEACCVKLHLQ